MNSFVFLDITRLSERLIAYITFVRPFSSMKPPMRFKMTLLTKWHLTVLTFEGFFPGMNSFMFFKIAGMRKPLFADVAFEWSFSRMDSTMNFKVTGLIEPLFANVTLETPFKSTFISRIYLDVIIKFIKFGYFDLCCLSLLFFVAFSSVVVVVSVSVSFKKAIDTF